MQVQQFADITGLDTEAVLERLAQAGVTGKKSGKASVNNAKLAEVFPEVCRLGTGGDLVIQAAPPAPVVVPAAPSEDGEVEDAVLDEPEDSVLPFDEEADEPAEESVKLHRPALTAPSVTEGIQFTGKDYYLANELKSLQNKCRPIRPPSMQWMTREGKRFQVYRPKLDDTLQKVGGMIYYAYDSLFDGDGKMLITAEEYEKYTSGDWRYRHMPFVSEGVLQQFEDLLKQYSMYTDKCTVGQEPINPELDRKAKLLVQRRFNPPGWTSVLYRRVQKGTWTQEKYEETLADYAKRRIQDLELPSMCYAHWMLLADQDIIQEEWMMLTLELQNKYRGNDLREQRIGRIADLINSIHARISERVLERGGTVPNKEQIGEMLIQFADKITR